MSCLEEVACTWRRKKLDWLTTQIKSWGGLDHAIQSLGLKLPHPGFYIGRLVLLVVSLQSHSFWCPLSRVTGTMTRYWLEANPQANSRCLVDIFNLHEEGKSSEMGWPTSWGIWVWCRRDTDERVLSSQLTDASFRKQSCSTSRPTETREVNCNVFVFGDRNSHKGWQEHKRGRRDH